MTTMPFFFPTINPPYFFFFSSPRAQSVPTSRNRNFSSENNNKTQILFEQIMSNTTNVSKRQKVIIDHDGGVDDLVAMIILAAYPELCELIGVIAIDADCFINPAVEVSGKVLSAMQLFGHRFQNNNNNSSEGVDKNDAKCNENLFEYLSKVPVGRSTLQAVHEFPREWRADAIKMNDLPCVNTPEVLAQWEANQKHEVYEEDVCGADGEGKEKKFKAGEELLAELVMKKGSPADKVTICVTGPLSNIAYCIKKYGKAFTDNVEAVVVMGGAVDVEGNVYESTLSKKSKSFAEWNIYWDAPSAKTVLESADIKTILFALDATNYVPVHSKFVQRFGTQKNNSFLSEFIGCSWAMCTFFQAVFGPDHAYYAWDALTAAWVVRSEIAADLEKVPISVILSDDTEAPQEEGRTKRLSAEEAEALSIRSNVYLPKKVYAEEFYDMMLELAKRL